MRSHNIQNKQLADTTEVESEVQFDSSVLDLYVNGEFVNVKCLSLQAIASATGVWRVNSVYIGGKWTELLLLPSGADDGDYADNDDDEVTTYSGHTSLWNIRVAKYVAEYMPDIIMWCMTLITHSFANTAYCAGDLCKFHVCVLSCRARARF